MLIQLETSKEPLILVILLLWKNSSSADALTHDDSLSRITYAGEDNGIILMQYGMLMVKLL